MVNIDKKCFFFIITPSNKIKNLTALTYMPTLERLKAVEDLGFATIDIINYECLLSSMLYY